MANPKVNGSSNGTKPPLTYKDTFEWFGVELREGHSHGNMNGDCPFCGKEYHFFVDIMSGQWDCKVCGEHGNIFTFFQLITELAFDETTAEQWRALEEDRGIPADAYRTVKAGFLERTNAWLIPIFSDKGTVRDVRCFRLGGKMHSPPMSSVQLAGLYQLANTNNRESEKIRVWIAEGEHDWIALRWYLAQVRPRDIVIGVPGAMTFKNDWLPWLQSCHVIVCGDADETGDKMQGKLHDRFRGLTRRTDFLQWEDERPEGFDLRDYIRECMAADVSPSTAITRLEERFGGVPRLEAVKEAIVAETAERNQLQSIAFIDLLNVYKQHVKVSSEFEQALAVSAATCLGCILPSDPIWVYLVGDAGIGKTLILNAFKKSNTVHYESTITRTSLMSGSDKGPDNSLLPKLHNKTAIFKDGTELLALHPDQKNEVMGILRGAFDGESHRQFGNGIRRDYICHFNCLIGITPEVRANTQDKMGERFLRFEMKEKNQQLVEDKMKSAQAAVLRIAEDSDREDAMVQAGTAFLSRKLDLTALPKISDDRMMHIRWMAELVAMLRATVSRDKRSGELLYRPGIESPTRVCKQLTKLAVMLAVVFDKPEVDQTCMDVVRRVAYDSCIDFNLDIVRYMMKLPLKGGMTSGEIAKAIHIDSTTIAGRLLDMEQLKIIRKDQVGRTAVMRTDQVTVYFLEKKMIDIWKGCQ